MDPNLPKKTESILRRPWQHFIGSSCYFLQQVATSSNAAGNNDGNDNPNSNGMRGGKGDENGREDFPMRGQQEPPGRRVGSGRVLNRGDREDYERRFEVPPRRSEPGDKYAFRRGGRDADEADMDPRGMRRCVARLFGEQEVASKDNATAVGPKMGPFHIEVVSDSGENAKGADLLVAL